MGFSVSASTAIIFISFLIAASTLYTAWENSYSNVQAAREDWYELRLSQVHFDVGDVSITASGSSDVSVSFKYLGQTISGTVVVLHNGTYVSSVNLGYLIPNNYYTITVTGRADTSGAINYATFGFDNGCMLLVEYYYDSAKLAYIVNGYSTQCPMEVS
ncbi:flagellar protein [Thermococcus sp. GR7]|uniref:flagellar protein n=1 Tax=unclassified Thermococcus TaxID=2627626 RepID=UPI001430917B|nr:MULTISPECIES: flagellar protein [unclassified Thermococcus]NJE47511.1 flagellar protein [Thermococcus sp. GR7]NJE78561.1 flagellar protein [Thermococcus sp. GR4]NJF23561.1 flagellar protein [Thermococcus sp. GR5]